MIAPMTPRHLAFFALVLVVLGAINAAPIGAGAFSGSDSDLFGRDAIVHPQGYGGTGGELRIEVCLDPLAPNAAEIPLQLAVRTWSELAATTANLDPSAGVPATALDAESWVLYGLGLCLGLDDPSDELGFTAATAGSNGMLQRDDGADDVAGSRDDARGDDENRMWFRIVDNDPFTTGPDPVDGSTFSRNPAILAEGENFATAPTRAVALFESVPGTEAVMVAALRPAEAKRTLAWDDVATLRLGQAGLDEDEGTADDYTVFLAYVGRDDACDLPVSFVDQAEITACVAGKGSLGGGHFRVNFNALTFAQAVDWHYAAGGRIFLDGFESGETSRWSASNP